MTFYHHLLLLLLLPLIPRHHHAVKSNRKQHALTHPRLLWLTQRGAAAQSGSGSSSARASLHRASHGVLPGVLQLSGQHRVLLPAGPLPDLQSAGDRGLRGGQDLPHTPAQRRRLPPQSGGHHRGGLPREGPGSGRRENQGTFYLDEEPVALNLFTTFFSPEFW